MKPRSKIELKMLALAAKLPPITDRQRGYAYTHCFRPMAVYKPRKREIRCLCCGHTSVWEKHLFDGILASEQYDCPQCIKSMDLECHKKGILLDEARFFSVITTFRGYQVIRTWEVERYNSDPGTPTDYNIHEVFQIWILNNGREIITGCPYVRQVHYFHWRHDKPFDIRQHNNSNQGGYYQFDDIYDITDNVLYPDVRVTPLVRRNGWCKEILKYSRMIPMTKAIRWLLSVPTAEMLVKTGQMDMFLYMVRRNDRTFPFLHAVRIANRNGYIVEDTQMWLDMLLMAATIGQDTHNPKVVCPVNLKKAHDAMMPLAARRREKENRKKQLAEMAYWETKYHEAKERFLGLCFGDDEVRISVIPSVTDMEAEGKVMHHCVFSAGYYKRDDCLILSARDREGNRLETIEVNLKTFEVAQSRAKFNKTSPQHKRILNLMSEHMELIRRATMA